jgi:hypothetical protein
MNEDEQLGSVLREWQAPEPGAAVDAQIRDAWRAECPPAWRRIWTARISVPVPLAVAALVLAAALIQFRRATPVVPDPKARLIVPQQTASGFIALPDGAVRVVSAKDFEQ